MDEKEQLQQLIKKLSDLESKVDTLSKMSIFVDKNKYISAISQAVRDATREDEKVEKLQELVTLTKFVITICFVSTLLIIGILMWLSE